MVRAMSRDLDVVVLGATGVTGRQVAVYLDQRAPDERPALGRGGARSGEGGARCSPSSA